jgi:hypothetical protein
MAGEKNFNIKNGLSIGGVEVIDSSGNIAAGVLFSLVWALFIYSSDPSASPSSTSPISSATFSMSLEIRTLIRLILIMICE